MIRYKTLDVSTVFKRYQQVMEGKSHRNRVVDELEGYQIKFSSHRLWTFNQHGTTCSNCGASGDFFAVEKNHEGEERPHINLYARTEDGEVLLTKDHVNPRSKGGKNHINNYQTLCKPCNEAKDDNT